MAALVNIWSLDELLVFHGVLGGYSQGVFNLHYFGFAFEDIVQEGTAEDFEFLDIPLPLQGNILFGTAVVSNSLGEASENRHAVL